MKLSAEPIEIRIIVAPVEGFEHPDVTPAMHETWRALGHTVLVACVSPTGLDDPRYVFSVYSADMGHVVRLAEEQFRDVALSAKLMAALDDCGEILVSVTISKLLPASVQDALNAALDRMGAGRAQ